MSMTIQQQIDRLRRARGMSEVQMAEASGVARSRLRDFLHGGNSELRTVERIVSLFPDHVLMLVPRELAAADPAELAAALRDLRSAMARVGGLLDGGNPVGATLYEASNVLSPEVERQVKELDALIDAGGLEKDKDM